MRKIVSIKKVRFSHKLEQTKEIPNNNEIHRLQVDDEKSEGLFQMKKSTTLCDLKSYDIV